MQRGCIRDEYTPSFYLCHASLSEASKVLYRFIASAQWLHEAEQLNISL